MRILSLLICITWSCCHGALLDIISDCCRRGTDFADLGRTCQDLETTPDISAADREACMTIMISCCSNRLRPVLCERAVEHRMFVGSCQTLRNDTCLSAGMECCECCELGIKAYNDGIPCNSMMTGTSCDQAFQQCCDSARLRFDEDECNNYASHLLCTERCINLIGSHVCECNPGNRLLEDNITCVAGGDTGEPTLRPPPPRYLTCDRAPCQHNCRQIGREYECSCLTGYELMSDGYSCTDIDECASRTPVCNYAERCLNNIGSFSCVNDVVCRSGLRYDGNSQRCVDVDECAERLHNCGDPSLCQNTYGSFECQSVRCPQNYYFNWQSRRCEDIDECTRGTHDCPDGFRCDNVEGGFTCVRTVPCGTGYVINGDSQQCEDVDECSQRNHNCQAKERCVNRRGSFDCEPCPLGFQVDENNRCTRDVDECQEGNDRCGEGTRCQNTHGAYECASVCMQGFEYNRALRACMDIDECRRGQANCAIYEVCQNLNGSFSCGCRRGFRPNGYGQCVDINECAEGQSECLPNQRCYNLQGQYQCRNMCRNGYRFLPVRNYCEDINECAEGTHRCQDNQQCINQEGGYVCQCPAGHQANREQGTCDDIDECRLGLCRGTCQNLPGSYVCTCPSGYSLMENKVTCKDIDECETGRDNCLQDEYCFNTRGAFKCERIQCPPYYRLQTSEEFQCVKSCPLNAADCSLSNLNNTISHTFVALPSITVLRNPIRLLTIGLPNYRPSYAGTSQTYFNLVSGNEDNHFSITRLFPRGQPTGYLSLQSPITGPYETILYLEIVTETRSAFSNWQPVKSSSSYLLIHINVGPYTY
ncbi:uncharacterized protein [Diadema antillarum]|uniref:uncharacterized protein n=1 Tax=Diadema antillarum TaxID=105358 RepID=UPI003A8B8D3F